MSLSVEAESPAVAFYERNGFTEVGEGHGGLTMRLELRRVAAEIHSRQGSSTAADGPIKRVDTLLRSTPWRASLPSARS